MPVVPIYPGFTDEEKPCWYMGESGYVSVICAECGKRSILRDGPNSAARSDGTRGHDIAADGTVKPSIVCPYKPCTWHVHGVLMDWKPPCPT